MKKSILALCIAGALSLASCSTISKTAAVADVATPVTACTTAELKVSSQKITYTFKPSKAIRRGGDKNVIAAAVSEALKANGNADVLVGMQYEMKKTRNFFGRKNIKYVTVTGYPATYTNFAPTQNHFPAPFAPCSK